MSDWFFMNQNRGHVVDFFDFDEGDIETPEIIWDLHQRFNVILRVINSRDFIKVPEFRDFCIETNLIMVTYFDWMDPNKTIHKFIGHAWEDILRNGSKGLGQKSEGPLESIHKGATKGIFQKICRSKPIF